MMASPGRWARWLHRLLEHYCKSPTRDPITVDGRAHAVAPACRPLANAPSRFEAEEASRAMANRKMVGLDTFPIGFT